MNDYYDRERINEKIEEVSRTTDEMLRDAAHDMQRLLDGQKGNEDKLLESFRRATSAIEDITAEIRALRRHVKPPLDKPASKGLS